MSNAGNPLVKKHDVDWNKVDEYKTGLSTKLRHEFEVRREAIPLVFVPGIMGSHLRRPGLPRDGKTDGLPNLRWSTDTGWVLSNLILADSDGPRRRALIVGSPRQTFNPDYLEVDEATPPGDGFQGIMKDYQEFLNKLREYKEWGELDKYFVFPVYAVGYNWTDDVLRGGKYLAKKIDTIIEEAKGVTGLCEKVILISHSMGGLICRSASELAGSRSKIAGIVHGVQPVNGSPAAYWRVKAGFEGGLLDILVRRALGSDGTRVTPVLGNIPGGLTLLPNKNYLTNNKEVGWLKITGSAKPIAPLPKKDPYQEIYREKARPKPDLGEAPSNNAYWGLIDPDLLNPDNAVVPGGNRRDRINADLNDPWPAYLRSLDKAESLHDLLSPSQGPLQHPQTFAVSGTGHDTAHVVELAIESNWVRSDSYPSKGFRGFFNDANGDRMQAVLQEPTGEGDGTVPLSSAEAVNVKGRPDPQDKSFAAEHQGAYGNDFGIVQEWAIDAIKTMAKHRYHEQRKGAAAK